MGGIKDESSHQKENTDYQQKYATAVRMEHRPNEKEISHAKVSWQTR
jgi:hypothetical protein